MIDQNKLQTLFIDEAGDLMEQASQTLLKLEQTPADENLLNDLFRSIHTIKGSANACGFTKLGAFVHHFEDRISLIRDKNLPDQIDSEIIDLFLNAVDNAKELLSLESQNSDQLPAGYQQCYQNLADLGRESQANADTEEQQTSDKASATYIQDYSQHITQLLENLKEQENLFLIRLSIDEDLFNRGINHLTFFKQLSKIGTIVDSYWNTSAIPALESFDNNCSYFNEIDIFLSSEFNYDDLYNSFIFLEEHEYEINLLTHYHKTIKNINQPEKQAQPIKSKAMIKVDHQKLDSLFDDVGELVIIQSYLQEAEQNLKGQNKTLLKNLKVLSQVTKRIQHKTMSLRMVSIHEVFEKMKRVVRDAARKCDKEVQLNLSGSETEVDKSLVDKLSEPLVHLIRNAIDHGLEDSTDERLAKGKTELGQISLQASHISGKIVIKVIDDGKGLDTEAIYNKALANGLISESEEMDEAQINHLILQPGFSTNQQATELSGRGVGLDVVNNFIQSLNGQLEITATKNVGSCFTISLPLSLAIMDGMVVQTDYERFIIPSLNINESLMISKDKIHLLQDKAEFIDLRGDMLPLVRLNQILALSEKKKAITESTLISLESSRGKFVLQVDDILGRQQFVVKPAGPLLAKINEISGSAILSNGEVALILNTEALY